MPLNRRHLAETQSDFYQQQSKTLLRWICWLLIGSGILSGWIMYQHFNREKPQYFVSTSDGVLVEIKTLPQ